MCHLLISYFSAGGPGLGMRNNANRPPRDQCFLEGEFFGDEKVLDFMLPGNKVGFVIGKGGEMIRTLQVSFQVFFLSFNVVNVPIFRIKPA